MSAECALAGRRGHEDQHAQCRQIVDVPLPGASGMLLISRCLCACHRSVVDGGAR
ncbi:hypothetical protein STRIP9103_04076 [Streptomyces ipomoeae 91-03]|uniref:Uncharacterized protein n=1 Tax=Streptomyces ipomoeae 91-03 TaxID=698759 RepID=L1L133_9ACTN|nr:hypothetical protein STRIP9103_04076 [Streptomyces ipomoeae 91-03]